MWYTDVLNSLVNKVKTEQQEGARQFLTLLFSTIKTKVTLLSAFHPMFLLGIIDKAFLQFGDKPEGSISLEEFAKHIFTLSIIFAKISEDRTALWNSDFLAVYYTSPIKGTINLNKRFNEAINELERDVLHKLDYVTTIDFLHLKAIFLQASPEVNSALITEYNDLKGASKVFDSFLRELVYPTPFFEPDKLIECYDSIKMNAEFANHPLLQQIFKMKRFGFLLKSYPVDRSLYKFQPSLIS